MQKIQLLPGVPLYTEPATSSSNGNPRASLKDVYDLITSDLEFAVANLTTDRIDKYRINKNVAELILAEVYQELAMADNTFMGKSNKQCPGSKGGISVNDRR